MSAPSYDLGQVIATDPYADQDGDGWAPGPDYPADGGITQLLSLLRDPDDADPTEQVQMPADVWDQISAVLLHQLLGIHSVAEEARRMGIH